MLVEAPDMADEIRPEIIALQAKLASFVKEKVDPDDQKNAIVEIQSGVGGDESALFASDLYKMYEAYVHNEKFNIEVIDFTPGNAGGFKNIVFMISGKNAYGTFKNESGSFRVQRIPKTETKGRVHTSISSVIVLPESNIEQSDIKKSDVKVETYNSGGKGGQNTNRSMNAIKLTHLPTGITACSQIKSQIQNLKLAWKALATKVHDTIQQQMQTESANKKRKLRGSGMRNERIRTFNFPQNRVTDHRIKKSYCLSTIISGDLTQIFLDLKNNLSDEDTRH